MGVGFVAVLPMASPASSLSRSALRVREALVRSAHRCRAGEPAAPFLRDRVRLLRLPHRLHEQGQIPLGHRSLDAHADGEPCLLDQLPAIQATALRLTLLEGLSLRAAAQKLEISPMSVQRAQKKAVAALKEVFLA